MAWLCTIKGLAVFLFTSKKPSPFRYTCLSQMCIRDRSCSACVQLKTVPSNRSPPSNMELDFKFVFIFFGITLGLSLIHIYVYKRQVYGNPARFIVVQSGARETYIRNIAHTFVRFARSKQIAQGLAVEADQAGDGFHRVVIPVGRRVAGYLKHTVSQKLQRCV